MRRFADWVAWVGSQTAAAHLLGISQTHVSQMCRGERRPGRDISAAIESASKAWPKGPIRAAEWSKRKQVRAASGAP